ncbi:hypothetical protein [Candidatus Magnetominusculus dajiuhuensis]|uniref:hypothetical protein n=1 Tax=Candidatus Magnetominusculus dajiuhuensis TaxID=3137712 RepID=UPI003B43A86F
MEKAEGGVLPVSDSAGDNRTPEDGGAAPEVNIETEAAASGKSTEDYKKDKRAMEILRKPFSEWTAKEKEFMKDYDTLEANPAGNPIDAVAFASLGTLAAILRSIFGNIVLDLSMDALMKYAEENFPGMGIRGIVLAAIILIAAKRKLDAEAVAKAEGKAAAAVAEEKAAADKAAADKAAADKAAADKAAADKAAADKAAADKAAADKAAADKAAADKAAADKAAADKAAADKAAADKAAADKAAADKAAADKAKSSEKIGEMYDETANYKYKAKSDAEKKANIVNTGDVTAGEAKKVGSSTDITGYKTEASQWDIEHSMSGHGKPEVKEKISQENEAHGEKVSPQDKIPEEQRVGKGGKPNVSLTKEDYQNIPKYREEALGDEGRVVFQPRNENKKFESVEYQVRKDDGVIHMIYKVDHVNEKMTFVTMYKVGYRKPPASR